VVDGSFLQRPELAGLWDLVVWVDTSFAEARRRGVARDADLLGGADKATAAFDRRYHAAARRYLAAVDPVASADVVFANDDPANPSVRVTARS
jgi:uridine kinase